MSAPAQHLSPARQMLERSRPLRVAELVQALDVGGLEVVVTELCLGLHGAGCEVVLLGTDRLGPVAARLAPAGIPALHVDARPGLDLGAVWRLGRILRQRRIAVLHTHNERAHLYGVLAARLGGVPVLLNTRHGRNEPDSPRGPLRRRLLARATDGIVTVSRDVVEVATGRDRIPPGKLHTIYNGVRLGRPAWDLEARAAARRELGLPPGALVVGSVGRLAREKDYATLLRAFARLVSLQARGADLHLAILGDGDERSALERLAIELGITGRSYFYGWQSEVSRLLPAFDIYAQSSLTEGISLTILEAMTAGLPVVVTAVGGNLEILHRDRDGRSGMLVQAGDAVALARALGELVESPERRTLLGEAARVRVEERFSYESMVREHVRLYERLLERRRER